MRDPKLDAEVHVIGGLNLLDACVEVGALRFVFASTGGAIYGEVPPGKRAAEDTVPAPISPYAIHKLAFEQLLAVYETHRGLKPTILRYANVYGPRQDPHGEAGVIAIFLDSALAGKTLRVNGLKRAGDGGCVRDYVFVSDVARMNVLALTGQMSDRVANVGTGIPTTTKSLPGDGEGAGRDGVASSRRARPGASHLLLDPPAPLATSARSPRFPPSRRDARLGRYALSAPARYAAQYRPNPVHDRRRAPCFGERAELDAELAHRTRIELVRDEHRGVAVERDVGPTAAGRQVSPWPRGVPVAAASLGEQLDAARRRRVRAEALAEPHASPDGAAAHVDGTGERDLRFDLLIRSVERRDQF